MYLDYYYLHSLFWEFVCFQIVVFVVKYDIPLCPIYLATFSATCIIPLFISFVKTLLDFNGNHQEKIRANHLVFIYFCFVL